MDKAVYAMRTRSPELNNDGYTLHRAHVSKGNINSLKARLAIIVLYEAPNKTALSSFKAMNTIGA